VPCKVAIKLDDKVMYDFDGNVVAIQRSVLDIRQNTK
jgi:hypothetical protein